MTTKNNRKCNKIINHKISGKNTKIYYLNTLSDSNSSTRRKKKIIKNGSKIKKYKETLDNQESNDSYERTINEYKKMSANLSSSLKKKKNHKRVKSCEDSMDSNFKQSLDKNNNELYFSENRSFNLINKIKKSRKLVVFTENNSKNKKNDNIYLTQNVSPKKIKEIKEIKERKEPMSYSNSFKIIKIKKNKANNNSNINTNLNSSNDISFRTNNNVSLEEIKNRLKDKLISVSQKLQSEIRTYEGPININCISLNSPEESMNNIIYIMTMNGFQCKKCKEYLIKCNKGYKSFYVELVKIKGNLLYIFIRK